MCIRDRVKQLHLTYFGGMDSATSGHVIIDGKDISKFKKKELTKYRREDIGFVFQFYNLVPNLTALENVELATQICKRPLAVSYTHLIWALNN